VDMTIEKTTEGEYDVSCPRQKVKSEKTRSRYKACFDKKVCAGCLLAGDCPTLNQKGQRAYYRETAGPRTVQDNDVCLQYGDIDKLWVNPPLSDGKFCYF